MDDGLKKPIMLHQHKLDLGQTLPTGTIPHWLLGYITYTQVTQSVRMSVVVTDYFTSCE